MPDSRSLVVALTRSESPTQLFLGDSRSGKLRKLTTGMVSRTAPAVSPDGKRIAYVEQALDSDLVEVMLDGSALRPILATARAELSGAWYSNGHEFVYTSDAGGVPEPWVRNVEDNRARPLVERPHDVLPPGVPKEFALAPDGERLAVTMWGREHTVWLFRRSGGKAVRVDPGNLDQHSPSWSADGNWIAYGRVRPKEQLVKAPAGGGEPVVIATLDWQSGPTQVAWSPTGEWIAWAADTLTLYSPDGKHQNKLGAARPRQPVAFSRDGKTLYTYIGQRGTGKYVIEAYDVASGHSRRTGAFEVDQNVSLTGMALHPDGKRFLATLEKSNPDIVLLEGF